MVMDTATIPVEQLRMRVRIRTGIQRWATDTVVRIRMEMAGMT